MTDFKLSTRHRWTRSWKNMSIVCSCKLVGASSAARPLQIERERWWGGGQTEEPSISKMENSQPFGVMVYLLKAKKLQLEQLARDSTDSQNAFWVTHLKKFAGPGGVKPDNNKKIQYYLTCSLSLPPTTGRSKNRRVKEVERSRPHTGGGRKSCC